MLKLKGDRCNRLIANGIGVLDSAPSFKEASVMDSCSENRDKPVRRVKKTKRATSKDLDLTILLLSIKNI